MGCPPTMPMCWWPSARQPIIFESSSARARWQAGGELGDQRLTGRVEPDWKGIEASPISGEQLGALLDLQKDGTISGKIAKDVFEIMLSEGGDPRDIVEKRGLKQVTDTGAIEKIVERRHRRQSGKGRAGEGEAGDARLVRRPGDEGERGKANPQAVNALLKAKLGIDCAKPIACGGRIRVYSALKPSQGGFPMRVLLVLFVDFRTFGSGCCVQRGRPRRDAEHHRAAAAGVPCATTAATAYSFAAPNIKTMYPTRRRLHGDGAAGLSAGLSAALAMRSAS